MHIFNHMPRERIWIDADAVDAITSELDRRGLSRAAVLCSATLNQPGAEGAAIIAALGRRVVAIFDGLSEHTPLASVLAAADVVKSSQADILIAIGGGSVIDGGKVVKAACNAGLHSAEDFALYSMANANAEPLPSGGLPLMAVPTTLSAAEFTCRAGYTNPLSGLKEGLHHLDLAPTSVILDPELALNTSIRLWTSSGIRAVDHAVEGIFSPQSWLGLRSQAAGGLKLLAQGLRDSFVDPTSVSARSQCQQGVWQISDTCEQVRMGASHGLGYLLGTMGGVPHGMTSCVLLPWVAAWNASVGPEADALVAKTLGSRTASEGIFALIDGLGLPTRIRDLGIDKAVLDRIADYAPKHPVVRNNPRSVVEPAEARALLETAW
jgi:maleylacetate reductase